MKAVSAEDNASQRLQHSPPTMSSFFKLPLELRTYVYEHALLETESTTKAKDRLDIMSTAGRPPALTQTCREIRAESTPVFLKNKFKVSVPYHFDISSAEAWFVLFDSFDTAKINLQIHWRATTGWSFHYHEQLIDLLQSGFDGQSHIIPRKPGTTWCVQGDYEAENTNSEGAAIDYMIRVFYSRDPDFAAKLEALSMAVLKLKATGKKWGDVEDVVRGTVYKQGVGFDSVWN